MTQLVLRPLDQIAARFGNQLLQMSTGKAQRVMGRALNYEGQRVFTSVRRAVRVQSSIPTPLVNRSMRTIKASTTGGALEFTIKGSGRELSLKLFKPRQFVKGTKATVWGKRQTFEGAFMGPKPGVVAPKLHGHVFAREGTGRSPIKRLFGPSVPREMVKDQSKAAFDTALPRVVERVGREIAAVLRGY